ncbi:glutathione S-transferase family protein [Massilia sp. IC2-476]|uniref:glutathione S-transferase family protein n=1 Tax=Massilia sp. IC2-476 TaxID=2887199 RepID=UPI001D1141F9|nr:glutathione S-transferase family protein [Massilia sp. IC2-476]MCC2971012.1 glutathione S-transferase family protein [Massilia sp. IC2-476]
MMLKLISHPLCPYVQRAVIALAEKGARYERIDIDLADKPAWFSAVSPLGKTPVLLVDGQPVFESSVICEYLDDTVAPRLHPENDLARARHRGWVEFASSVLNTIGSLYSAQDGAAFDTALGLLRERFAFLETVLGEGPYFGGLEFSLVDAAFGPVFRYLDLFDAHGVHCVPPELRKVATWRRALAARPSVVDAVAGDYPERLRAFILRRGGVLAQILSGEAALA